MFPNLGQPSLVPKPTSFDLNAKLILRISGVLALPKVSMLCHPELRIAFRLHLLNDGARSVFRLLSLFQEHFVDFCRYLGPRLNEFQYKALYHNGQDAWTLDEDQHAQLRRFDWIYYGLSDLTSLAQHRDALDHLRVLPPGFRYSNRLTSTDLQQLGGRDLRWEEFFEGLQTCKYGRKVRNRKDFLRALWPHTADVPPEITRIVNDIVVVDFVNRRARKFTL
jgi:hypothetical protein